MVLVVFRTPMSSLIKMRRYFLLTSVQCMLLFSTSSEFRLQGNLKVQNLGNYNSID